MIGVRSIYVGKAKSAKRVMPDTIGLGVRYTSHGGPLVVSSQNHCRDKAYPVAIGALVARRAMLATAAPKSRGEGERGEKGPARHD